MTYLLDTNAFSDLAREDVKVEARLLGVADSDSVVICLVVRGEIRYGIERLPHGNKRQALESKAAKLFATLPCEPMSEMVGDYYATVKIIRDQKSIGLGENDLWIAATVMSLGATLVTRDRAFQNVPGLLVEDWTL